MTSTNTKRERRFCIFDYFLDGAFLRWEEVKGQCPILIPGNDWTVNLEDGTQITAEIVEIENLSEDECRVYLSSC